MQTPKQPRSAHAVFGPVLPAQKSGQAIFVLCLAALLPCLSACKKEASFEAIETDANGYLCSKCGAKFYTDRSVFLALKCPKCGQDGLVEVVAYFCPKDNHLTLTGRQGDRQSNTACEKCG